jgi:hypothetical protein
MERHGNALGGDEVGDRYQPLGTRQGQKSKQHRPTLLPYKVRNYRKAGTDNHKNNDYDFSYAVTRKQLHSFHLLEIERAITFELTPRHRGSSAVVGYRPANSTAGYGVDVRKSLHRARPEIASQRSRLLLGN